MSEAASRPRTPVVLDCDTGTDDAVAIACAALHPGLDLLGVCTVWGNADVATTTDNSLRVLDLLGVEGVPVVPGLDGPFAGRATALPSGRDDIPTALDLPPARTAAHPGHAPDWLAETVLASAAPVTVVTTGPLSNLAAALQRHPGLGARLGPVVALVGSHERDGVGPLVERNAWCDPSAVAAVLDSAVADLAFVGMDATYAAPLDADDVAALRSLGTPAAAMAAAMAQERLAWYDGPAPLHDPLAVAQVVEPRVVTVRPARAEVDLDDGASYGRTRYALEPGAPARLGVGLAADHDRFLAWLLDVLGRSPRR